MAIANAEVKVGAVAYFDPALLGADKRVIVPANPTTRPGPFVCFEVSGTQSAWAPLTWTARDERIEIIKKWRINGTKAWQEKTPYLNDGATTYVGDNAAFVDASQTADTYIPSTRQAVSNEGVKAIIAEVDSRKGNRLQNQKAPTTPPTVQ